MSVAQNTEQSTKSRGLKRRVFVAVLKVVVVIIALYFLLPWVGLRVLRVPRSSVAIEGSVLEQSRAETIELTQNATRPVNVIVFVADGLGFAHLSAARAALHGMGGSTAWDRFTATGWHQPHSATGYLVDSAASGTALATGVPTHNDRVGVDVEHEPLANLFERATKLGYRGGIVTDSYIWDATPAAFATHAVSRDDAESILEQLADSSLEILVGELEDLGEEEVPELEPTVAILEQRFRVFGPDAQGTEEFMVEGSRGGPVAAIFEEDQVTDLESTPTLPEVLSVALARLSSDDRPFVLLVESEEADSASHRSDFGRLLRGLEVIESALELVLDFAETDGRTLVVFTSDHETGGLVLGLGDPTNKSMKALWSTSHHSGVVVPVLARGPGAESFGGIHATWEIGRLLGEMLEQPIVAPETPAVVEQAY